MIVFAILTSILVVLILRGIVRRLDRLPAIDPAHALESVDNRALLACAEDLEKLELSARALGTRMISGEAGSEDWEDSARPLEVERLRIVARCRLNESTQDPVVEDLSNAASELEELIRSYALLYQRYRSETKPHADEAKNALRRSGEALKNR